MSHENWANDWSAVVATAIDDNDTTLEVDSTVGAPAANFRIRVGDELMMVTAVSSPNLTIVRGIEGTTAASHATDVDVVHVLTRDGLENAVQQITDISRHRSMINDDCFFSVNSQIMHGGVVQNVSGTGTAMTNGSVSVKHPGVIQLETGTTSTGRAGLTSNFNTVEYSTAVETTFKSIVMIPTLSDASQRFTVRTGIGAISAGDSAGYYFRYIDSVNSGKWQAVLRLSGGGETAADTGVTADTSWHTFRIFIPGGTATPVEFYIDDVLVVSQSTTTNNTIISSGTVLLPPAPIGIVKSIGGTERTVQIDAYSFVWEYTSER